MTAPALQVGQRIELDITTVAFGGDGIGRIENFVMRNNNCNHTH